SSRHESNLQNARLGLLNEVWVGVPDDRFDVEELRDSPLDHRGEEHARAMGRGARYQRLLNDIENVIHDQAHSLTRAGIHDDLDGVGSRGEGRGPGGETMALGRWAAATQGP